MATLGAENIQFALIDPDTFNVITGINGINGDATDTTGIFTVDEKTSKGVVSAALSNLSGAFTAVYGSNKLVWLSQGKAAPQIVANINELPIDVKARMLGQVSDGKGGYQIGGKNDAHLAALIKTAKAFESDEDVYYGFYSLQASETAVNMTSNNATEQRSQDALTMNASERGDDGFGKLFDGADKNFTVAAMMSDVFKTSPVVAPKTV